MNGTDFLQRHGEKVLLAVIAAICAYVLWSAATDSEIRVEARGDINADNIGTVVKDISQARDQVKAPDLQAPPDYARGLRDRLSAPAPTPKKYAVGLTAHPDAGPADTEPPSYILVYEMRTPTLTAKDDAGSIELSLSLPKGGDDRDKRITDDPAATAEWTNAQMTNRAEDRAIYVEYKVGAKGWQPLAIAGRVKNGLVDVEKINEAIRWDKVDAWTTYQFRCSLVTVATGYWPFGARAPSESQTVVVTPGPFMPNAEVADWTMELIRVADRIRSGDKETVAQFVRPRDGMPGITKLEKNDLVYVGPSSDPVSVVATSSIRVALKKVGPDPANPNVLVADLLVNKLFRDRKNPQGSWMKAPVLFRNLKEGDSVGGSVAVVNPLTNQQETENLNSDFVIASLKRGEKRVKYYVISSKSRPNGGKDRDLQWEAKEDTNASVVVLKNQKTDSPPLELIALAKITKPSGNKVFYPFFAQQMLEEDKEFEANPGTFVQSPLRPPEPEPHKPDAGPLVALARTDKSIATDTDYFELADGRLVYWNTIQHKMLTTDKKGAQLQEPGEDASGTDTPESADPPDEGE
jgi:hypothetical protein